MDRRSFLKNVGIGLAAASGVAASRRAFAASKPNIVLIMADDLGYGHLGCYGQEHIRTPNLDRLAQEGLRFTDAYAGCPQCAPSRSVLMTGYHSGHTPVRGNSGGIPLRDDDVTLGEVLQASGYRTGLFGKWGLGEAETSGAPNRQGFDEFFGYLHQKHAHFYYTDYLWHNTERYPLPGNREGKRQQYSQDVILDKAIDFIETSGDKPFFLFHSLSIPHHEWTVPEASLKEYAGTFEEHPPEFRWREGYAMPKAPKANMAAMISHMDRGVGRLLDALEAQGLRENTLVIFTSDNGADSYSIASADFFKANAPLRGYKYDLYEGGIRVPAIANWPGHIAAGGASDHPWYFADLMPTFAELAGAETSVPENVDGLSFLPALLGADAAGRPQAAHEFLYWEADPEHRAARVGNWKIVKPGKDAAPELYDLGEDIAEEKDLAAQHPDLVARLEKLLEENHVDAPPQIEPPAPDGRYYR